MAITKPPGHIHQAERTAGVVVTIWATPWPGLWHVSSSRKQATEEQVAAILKAWNFTAEYWAHSPGPLHEVNPSPEIWAMYEAIR